MESVWWVFKTLFEKGLVYRGFKVRASAHRACCDCSVWRNKRRAVVQVMPYSNAVNTPLSNFEANLNYKDATDPSVVVTFPVVSDPGTGRAGCSTPWLWRARVRCVIDVPSVLQS